MRLSIGFKDRNGLWCLHIAAIMDEYGQTDVVVVAVVVVPSLLLSLIVIVVVGGWRRS